MSHDRQPSRHQDKSNQKLNQNFGLNKRAFDSCMSCYRAAQFTGIEATDYSRTHSTSPNRARATSVDLRIDIDLCIRKIVPAVKMERFKAAYCFYDSDTAVEHEVVAEHVYGPKRHRIEQCLGALFIEKGIWPIKGYFQTTRKRLDEWKNSGESTIRHERLQEVTVGDGGLPVQPTQQESIVDDAALTELLEAAFKYEKSQGGAPAESECEVHEAI